MLHSFNKINSPKTLNCDIICYIEEKLTIGKEKTYNIYMLIRLW